MKNKSIRRVLVCSTFLAAMLVPSVSASAHYFRSLKSTRHISRVSRQASRYDQSVRLQIIRDINNERRAHRLRKLKVTSPAQKLANYRAPKVLYAYNHYDDYTKYPHNTSNPSDNWVHGIDTHTTPDYWLNRHHYRWSLYDSNAASWAKGKTSWDGVMVHYNDNTPKHTANNINDVMMNHDDSNGNDNVHRKAVLDNKVKYIGVSVNYDHNSRIGSVNEQFLS